MMTSLVVDARKKREQKNKRGDVPSKEAEIKLSVKKNLVNIKKKQKKPRKRNISENINNIPNIFRQRKTNNI